MIETILLAVVIAISGFWGLSFVTAIGMSVRDAYRADGAKVILVGIGVVVWILFLADLHG